MALFCPLCSNMLYMHVDRPEKLECPTCSYHFRLNEDVGLVTRSQLTRKKLEEVRSVGESQWKDETTAQCPSCDHRRAWFYQIQIRSADEPMTIFYKCMKCTHRWREN